MLEFKWFKKFSTREYTAKDIQVISDVSESILSTQKLDELLQQAVDRVVTRYGFLGGVFLLKEGDSLYAKTISRGKVAVRFLDLIGMPIHELRTGIKSNKSNYIVKSVLNKDIIVGSDLNAFVKGVISKKVGIVAKRLTNTKSCLSIPVLYKGKVLGAFFISESQKTDFAFELPILKTFANQLALAIVNARLYEDTQLQIKKLEEKNQELNALRRREQDMMDIMGHELRTPLSIIRISMGLLEQKYSKIKSSVTEELDPYLLRIKDALERETRLLEAMLNSTKIEADKIELRYEKVDLDSIVKDAMLALGGKAQKKNLQFVYNPPSKKPYVYADSVRLGEVIDNLVLNAIKYTEKGSVTISVKSEQDKYRISIEDTGIGIPKEDIKHLGEKFYRVGQYSNNAQDKKKRSQLEEKQITLVKPGGTGLGLYVSYNLVNLMGGEIKVDSEINKGSKFSFSLPKHTNQPDTHSKRKPQKNLFNRLGFTQHKS